MVWVERRARLSWCKLTAVKWARGGADGERHVCTARLLSWAVVATGEFGTRLRRSNGLHVYTKCPGYATDDDNCIGTKFH